MGDSGEGLVDAEARIQEQIEEREAERRRRMGGSGPKLDPEKLRELESLRLAKSNLERQAEATAHPVRKQQIKLALAEIDKRLAVDCRRARCAVPVRLEAAEQVRLPGRTVT